MVAPGRPIGAPDRDCLHAFRQAAAQVRGSTVIDHGREIKLRGELVAGEYRITADLLETEPFRSLALSVRLVYQNDEPAQFGRICGIIEQCGDAAMQKEERRLKREYNNALNTHSPFFQFIGLFVYHPFLVLTDPRYSPRGMFETWLYHGVFHQDLRRRADYEEFSALGDVFPYTVQSVVLLLAGRTLDLDDVVADLLQEERVPRIGSPEASA